MFDIPENGHVDYIKKQFYTNCVQTTVQNTKIK